MAPSRIDPSIRRIGQAYGFRPQLTTIVDSQGSCSDDTGLNIPLALKTKKEYGTVAKYPRQGHRNSDGTHLISNSEAEVVVETTPTNFKDAEPGLSNIKAALANGKHVVTANKGPLALAMPALLELANHRNDVGLVADAFDDFVGNHANSANVTPAPPSFQAPSRKPLTRVSLRSISATRSRNAPVPFP